MERRNRYKNGIGLGTVLRLFIAGGGVLATGVGFVYMRNSHVMEGDKISKVEHEIQALNQQIELWELRIAAVRDRQELSRRLRWVQSDLAGIDMSKVIEITPPSPSDGLGKKEGTWTPE